VRFDDGQLAMAIGYSNTIEKSVRLAADQDKREEEMQNKLPLVIGKCLYADQYSALYLGAFEN
jgi:hypothetical protein